MAMMIRRDDPGISFFHKMASNLSDLCLEKIIQNLFINFMVLGKGVRERREKELGLHLPNFMVISPTMKCNLNCVGCYAGEYDQEEMLTFDEMDRIISEAKDLGMYFFTFTGGECLMHPDIFKIWKKHNDCYFIFYTNGTLLTDEVIERLASMGNVAPMVSVEGDEHNTDARRGSGIYKKIRAAFRKMKALKLAYGFSATYTNQSWHSLTSDDFILDMIDKGCSIGWYFQYIPIGKKPDLTYMATPEQREYLRQTIASWRSKPGYPIFIGDFWNDSPFVDGCMAGGARYLHIISDGSVTPCVFVPFAVDSIREKSLIDILRGPFFSSIREAQPYDGEDNLYRPCMIIDHPHIFRDLVKKYGAHPCHPGLQDMLDGPIAEGLDSYSKDFKRTSDPVWENYGKERFKKTVNKE